jgi:hypothetical protein
MRVDPTFETFVEGRSTALLRTAYLLTGDRGPPHSASRTAIALRSRCACSSVSQWTTTSSQYRSKRTAGNSRAIHASNASCMNRFADNGEIAEPRRAATIPRDQATWRYRAYRVAWKVRPSKANNAVQCRSAPAGEYAAVSLMVYPCAAPSYTSD